MQVQSLQKRLIAVTEAGVEKGMQLQESAAELASVREQLAARPGNDTWQKLSKSQVRLLHTMYTTYGKTRLLPPHTVVISLFLSFHVHISQLM